VKGGKSCDRARNGAWASRSSDPYILNLYCMKWSRIFSPVLDHLYRPRYPGERGTHFCCTPESIPGKCL